MSQGDFIVANQGFPAFRSDLNAQLQALGSTSIGTARPATPYQGELWIDSNTPSATLWSLMCYDGVDDITLGWIDSTNNRFIPWAAVGARVVTKATAYTLAQAERGELHTVSHATGFTVTLLAAATATNGFTIGFANIGVGNITIDGNAAETIDGQATIVLPTGETATLVCDGTGWRSIAQGGLSSGVRANKAAVDQVGVVQNVATKVTFSTEVFDIQNEFAASTFTSKTGGVYSVSAAIQVNGIANNKRVTALIYVNGAETVRGSATNGTGAANNISANIAATIQLESGDTVEAYVIHDDTVARDLDGVIQRTWFSIARAG